MKTKNLKIFAIIVSIIILVSVIFFAIDYNRAKSNKAPIFCILKTEVNDGGTKIYLGLGYKVIDFNTSDGYDDVQIGTWSMQYEDWVN